MTRSLVRLVTGTHGEFFHAFLVRTETALPATFKGGGEGRGGGEEEHLAGPCGEMASFGLRGGPERRADGCLMRGGRPRGHAGGSGARGSPTSQCLAAVVSSEVGRAVPQLCLWGRPDRAKLRLPAVRMGNAFARRMRQVFAEACPKPRLPRNDWISEETWLALGVHGHLRSFRDARRRCALLLTCFLVRWRESRDLLIGTSNWAM